MSSPENKNPQDLPKKQLTASEAKVKIVAYCAYQERCHKEVRDKLYSYGINSSEVEKLITFLILEGFLNEERFAKALARGKFRLKRWGRLRIRKELKNRMINEYCINSGLKEINEQEYWETLNFVAERKWIKITETNPLIKKMKLYRFLAYKGFENDLIESAYHKLTANP